MNIRFLFPLLILFASVSCTPQKHQTVYYTTAYLAPLWNKKLSLKNSLNWGEPLLAQKETLTNNLKEVFVQVIRKLDQESGYVKLSDVQTNVLFPAVILNTVLLYDTPSLASLHKYLVQPPLTVFVLEIRKDGWVHILPSLPPLNYRINTNTMIDLSDSWIQQNLISTNAQDITIITALQLAVSDYREALKTANSIDNKQTLRQTIEIESRAIENLIHSYPDRAALIYAKQLLKNISFQSTVFSHESPLLDENLTSNERTLLEQKQSLSNTKISKEAVEEL